VLHRQEPYHVSHPGRRYCGMRHAARDTRQGGCRGGSPWARRSPSSRNGSGRPLGQRAQQARPGAGPRPAGCVGLVQGLARGSRPPHGLPSIP
jgi:hypothetical protein